MKKAKKMLALALALTSVFSVVGCGDKKEESSYEPQVEVPTDESIDPIPEGAESELEWLSYFDLNPSRKGEEPSTELTLFQEKGGSIKYTRTTSTTKYTTLATRVMSGDVPDLFWYELKMTFPAQAIKGMFQPVDSIVDFDSALWSDVKDIANQYVIKDQHYVAPISFNARSVIVYDKAVLEETDLDDPYEDYYLENNWTWDTMEEMMKDYVDGATGDEIRYGVNGWFHSFIFQSTGKTLINFDSDKQEYVSNLNDPDIERAANWLYDISNQNLVDVTWYDDAQKAFDANNLFFAMGPWASTASHTPAEGKEWGVVPIPRDPQSDTYYTSLDTTAYMWVKGSTKTDAVKTWFECAKLANTSETYKEVAKEKFFVNNPQWTEEMYNVAYGDDLRTNFTIVFDPGYGISTMLSDDDANPLGNDSMEAVIPYLYSSVSKVDENGAHYTWATLRSTYANTVQQELDTFNAQYKAFLNS